MEVTSKMDFLDHGPNNIIKVENRKSLLIVELTKYDDWFHQQVNCNSNQVNEKMDHLTDQINLEILSEQVRRTYNPWAICLRRCITFNQCYIFVNRWRAYNQLNSTL